MVAVIGAGAWGNALASSLSSNNRKVIQYSRRKNLEAVSSNISLTNDLSDIIKEKYILLVLPAQQTRDLVKKLTNIISNECIIIICSKGIESETGKLLSEVVSEYLPKNEIAVLSGPNFAKEIQDGMQTISSLAAKDISTANQIINDLNFKNIKLIPTDEMISVQLFGSLKNVLAILCGFSEGLSLGENAKASLITKGVKEISDLASELSKKDISIDNPGCIGDIILTCTSITSRNTKFGMDFIKKYVRNSPNVCIGDDTVEGVFTVKALHKIDIKNYPLLKFASQIVFSDTNKNSLIEEDFKNILFS